MKALSYVIVLPLFCMSCVSTTEVMRSISDDKNYTAVIAVKQKRAMWLPGPEPARVRSQTGHLAIYEQGKKVVELIADVGVDPFDGFAFDIMWSPKSDRLAYRCANTFWIIDPKAGRQKEYAVAPTNSLLSSFRWLSDTDILAVTKAINYPTVDADGHPRYDGFVAKSTDVRIWNIDLQTGKMVNMFSQRTARTVFLFHSVGFQVDEISPNSTRIAFSDGKDMCVYDRTMHECLVQQEMQGAIEGIWWVDDDNLLIGIDLLSGQSRFALMDVRSGRWRDATVELSSRWKGVFTNVDWFRGSNKADHESRR